jgi:cytochrome P450
MLTKQSIRPPSLSPYELFRMKKRLRKNTLEVFMELALSHGHIFCFRNLWLTFMVLHPDDIEYVLQNNSRNYLRGRSYRVLREAAGNGLFVSEGEFWRRQRRLAQPAFHRDRIAGFGKVFTDSALEVAERWSKLDKERKPVEVFSEMSQLTLRIVGKTLFSTDLIEQTETMGRMMEIGSEYAIKRMWKFIKLPTSLPTKENRRHRAVMEEGDRVIYGMINERRRQPKVGAHDLLSMLMSARDEETGQGMDDKQLRDEAFSLMVAGHETSALALTWAWYLLGQHPEVEEKLHEELAAVLNGRPPALEDLPNLKYTTMVIHETLRLYPPVYGLGRTAINDDNIGGYHVPKKSEVVILPYITHRHPDFWDEPDKFDPERFAPERANSRMRYAYFPFGGGPRQCIGNNFALMECYLILATLAQNYRLSLVPGHKVEHDPSVTLRPRYGIRMNLQRVV